MSRSGGRAQRSRKSRNPPAIAGQNGGCRRRGPPNGEQRRELRGRGATPKVARKLRVGHPNARPRASAGRLGRGSRSIELTPDAPRQRPFTEQPLQVQLDNEEPATAAAAT